MTVLHRDEHGAEVQTSRRTAIGRHARFRDTYAAPPLLQLERRYADQPNASSIWTVEPAAGGRSYYTVDAQMLVPAPLGILLWPLLRRMYWQLNFPPSIQAAEHDATLAGIGDAAAQAQPKAAAG